MENSHGQPGRCRIAQHQRCRGDLLGIVENGLSQLRKLKPLAEKQGFRDAVRRAKREAKVQFAGWLKSATGQIVDPDSIFDCRIWRTHEYKRQLLNALRVVALYNR